MRRIYLLLPLLISSACFAHCLLTDEGKKSYYEVDAQGCGDTGSEICIHAVRKSEATPESFTTIVDRMGDEVCTEYHACCTTRGDQFISKIYMPCYAGFYDGGAVICDNSVMPYRAIFEMQSGTHIATCYLN